jgi:sialic acid synthase SpsE
VQLTVQKAEEKSRIFKRSIYVVDDIKAGEVFTKENTRVIRPGDGLAPKYYGEILGKKAKSDIKKGTPLDRAML